MARRRLWTMKKVSFFMCGTMLCLYMIFYKMCCHKGNLLLRNRTNSTESLQHNFVQWAVQEILRGKEDITGQNATQASFWETSEATQSHLVSSRINLKTNDSRVNGSSSSQVHIKKTTVSEKPLPASNRDLSRIISNTPEKSNKVKITLKNQWNSWMIWNDESSSSNLNRRLRTVKNNYVSMNKYAVNFTGTRKLRKLSSKELLCELKQRVQMASIEYGDEAFMTSDWREYLPNKNLMQAVKPFKTCAVVASAGSILHSMLGMEIDAHDAVLRFNGAPTLGFESDVGRRTTIRIINSQLILRKEFKFLDNDLYRKGILLVWDPAPYSSNLTEWFNHPDYDFFDNYKKYRKSNSDQLFYIMNPKVQWQLWDILQENTAEEIQRNPPSSGLLGIILMMHICNQTDVYEFLPSKRETDLCHYYEKFRDQACTMGAYHPLMFEKNLVKRINQGPDEDIYLKGKVTLPGFRTFECPKT